MTNILLTIVMVFSNYTGNVNLIDKSVTSTNFFLNAHINGEDYAIPFQKIVYPENKVATNICEVMIRKYYPKGAKGAKSYYYHGEGKRPEDPVYGSRFTHAPEFQNKYRPDHLKNIPATDANRFPSDKPKPATPTSERSDETFYAH